MTLKIIPDKMEATVSADCDFFMGFWWVFVRKMIYADGTKHCHLEDSRPSRLTYQMSSFNPNLR